MPIRLIIAIIILIIAVPLLFFKSVTIDKDTRYEKVIPLRKIGLLPLAFGLFLVLTSMVRVVDPGHVGIPVTFGNAGAPLNPGVAFTNPFAEVHEMSIRTEDYTMTIDESGDASLRVQGSDGATGVLDATILYRLDKAQASRVYREIGTDYEGRIVRPFASRCVPDSFVSHTMLDGATVARGEIAVAIEECLRRGFEPRGIILESFEMRGVNVSPEVQTAIDSRVAAAEQAEQAQFELERTYIQSEQRRVEAQGVADAEQIIVCGATTTVNEDGLEIVTPKDGDSCEDNLTPQYLMLQYIQAIEGLVDAGGTTLILPADQDLTPLLNLGGGQ